MRGKAKARRSACAVEGAGREVELVGAVGKVVNLPLVLQGGSLPLPVEPLEHPLEGKSLRRNTALLGKILELLAGNEVHPQLKDLSLPEPLTGPGALVVSIRSKRSEVRGELLVIDNLITGSLGGTTMTPRRSGLEVGPSTQSTKGRKRHGSHDNG